MRRKSIRGLRFIDRNHHVFGLRWVPARMGIYPNAYFNSGKHRKEKQELRKKKVLALITELYHKGYGADRYRPMTIYLARQGYRYSKATIHKDRNKELSLKSIVRRKKPDDRKGKAHKVFENKLEQNFSACRMNQKRCTDLPYVYLKNHAVRYNCRVPDLYDRSVVASITDRYIPSDLSIRTLKKALASQPALKGEFILHLDQGSQYTSKAFVEFCESLHITQSRSKAGYPYDDAPMERCFHTLKNDCLNLYEFRKEEDLYRTIEEFAYIKYNYVRPHSYNNYKTPMEVRRVG